MIRVLIADDESPARERIRHLLSAHSEFEVVAEAATGAEAMTLASTHKPDLLLLDIQMPDGSGLDVAACLASPRPAVIFCTAFDQHAVDAFELNAVDYLLKPVSRARLAQALARVAHIHSSDQEAALDRIAHQPAGRLTRFLVRHDAHYIVVPAAKVSYFESTDRLTRLVADTGQSYWIDPPLNELETRVDPARFFRVSRAAIVNLQTVAELHPLTGGAGEVVLKNGVKLEVSRRRLRDLMKWLESA